MSELSFCRFNQPALRVVQKVLFMVLEVMKAFFSAIQSILSARVNDDAMVLASRSIISLLLIIDFL